jgi:hypothetical protein
MAHPKILALRELLQKRHGSAILPPTPPNSFSPFFSHSFSPSHPAPVPAPVPYPVAPAEADSWLGTVRFRTGVAVLDDALGGGLPKGRLVELTGSGGSALLVELVTRSAQHGIRTGAENWTALVDGCDALDVGGLPEDVRQRLFWIRCGGVLQALQATELLVKDGNLPLIVVDLRGCAPAALRGLAPALWHRIQRGLESGGCAAVVFTPVQTVASARSRLRILPPRFSLAALEEPRDRLVDRFGLEFVRGYRSLAATA